MTGRRPTDKGRTHETEPSQNAPAANRGHNRGGAELAAEPAGRGRPRVLVERRRSQRIGEPGDAFSAHDLERHSGCRDGCAHVVDRDRTRRRHGRILRDPRWWSAQQRLSELELSLDRDELHRHGHIDRHSRIHGHGGVAQLDGDEHDQIGDRHLRPGHSLPDPSRELHAHCRRNRQPDDHRQGCEQQHGQHLLGLKDPHLQRTLELTERKSTRLPGDGHVHGGRGHGLDQTVRRPDHHGQSEGRHARRHLAQPHRKSWRNQEIDGAHAFRTGSGRRVQRDAHRHRRICQRHDRLCGLKDAHLERPRQRAQRYGARISGLGDERDVQ